MDSSLFKMIVYTITLLLVWKFILIITSTSQIAWSNKLIIICLKEGYFYCSLVVKTLACSGCFSACMGVHFPTAEFYNAIWFSIVWPFQGCQDFFGTVLYGFAGSAMSFSMHQDLKCYIALTIWLLCSNCILPSLFLSSHKLNSNI